VIASVRNSHGPSPANANPSIAERSVSGKSSVAINGAASTDPEQSATASRRVGNRATTPATTRLISATVTAVT
jgi:hypothetical protein